MAIIVEDGTIVPNANSYVSVADLETYALERGIIIAGDPEELLIKSMDYTESLIFKGIKWTQNQTLQWPRANVWIDGYLNNVTNIPVQLKNGQMETALSIDSGDDPLSSIQRQKSSVKVGELAVTYEKGQATTINRKISTAFAKVVQGGIGGNTFVVGKA